MKIINDHYIYIYDGKMGKTLGCSQGVDNPVTDQRKTVKTVNRKINKEKIEGGLFCFVFVSF